MSSMQREASYEDGSFMSFKAVNRENLHLSPPFVHNHQWTGPTKLFSISNALGWFAAGTDDTVILSPLADLRDACKEARKTFQPKVSVPLGIKPISVTFANHHSSLVIAHLNGVISVYDSSPLQNASHTGSLPLVYTFSHSPEPIRHLQPNPSDKPEIVAVLRGDVSMGTMIEMLNVAAGTVVSAWSGRSAQEAQLCMAWSPKGKQLTVGDVTGALIQYTPEGVQKSAISAPPDHRAWPATSVVWLENTVFYVTYASPGVSPEEQEFYCCAIQTDKIGGTPTYISTPDAAPAFGDRSRESARFFVSLRDWMPMKHTLVVADQPSTDVGVIVQHHEPPSSDWATLELEETDRVVLPMDDEGRDTYPVGVDIDLTSTDPVNLATHGGDETPPAPPSPILYVYVNTGHLAAYHVLNSKQPSYPGMNPSAKSQTSTTTTTPIDTVSPMEMAITPSVEKPPSAIGTPTPLSSTSPQLSSSAAPSSSSPFSQPGFGAFGNFSSGSGAFGGSSSGSAFGSTFAPNPSVGAFGSTSGSGKPSAFTPAPGGFGSSLTPVFGQPSFGQSSFGQPLTLGSSLQPQSNQLATPSGGGFASFAKPAASGFASFAQPSGTSGFGAIGSSTNVLDNTPGSGGMDVSPVTPREASPAPAPTSTSAATSAFSPSPVLPSAPAVTTPGTPGAFGTGAIGAGSSVFANAAQDSSVTIAPAFGGQTPGPSTATPPFGSPQTSSSSPFGKSSVFGQSGAPASPPLLPTSTPSPSTAAPLPPPSTQSSSIFAKGFLGGNAFGTGAFAKAAQSASTVNTSSTPNAFSAFAPPNTMASASGSATPSGATTPTFGQPSILGGKPTFGSTFSGTSSTSASSTPASTAVSATPTHAPASAGGGFSAYAGGGGFTSSFAKVDTSKSAFELSGTSETPGSSNIFGTVKKPGLLSQSARSPKEEEDDIESASPAKPSRFDEEAIADRELEKVDNGSLGSLFNSAVSSAERSANVNQQATSWTVASLSLGVLDEALKSSASQSLPSPEPVTPERRSPPSKADQPDSTTPEGSPTKLEPPKPVGPSLNAISRSQSVSPPPPAPASGPSSLSGLGIGRPASAPRLSVPGTSQFSSAPTRSSPLAATPPINRKDVTDSPSPPKPARPSGGLFSKSVDEDDDAEADDDFEEFLKSRSKATALAHKGKPKSKSPDVFSAPKEEKSSQPQRTPSVSPPASVPISDSPKTVQRVKTPPLMGLGLGSGAKKSTTLMSKPSTSDSAAGKPTTQHILPASPSSPNLFAAPVPQKPSVFEGGPPIPSFQRTQAPTPPRSPIATFQSPLSAPAPSAQPKIEAMPPLENQKPTIGGQVDRIVTIMEKELSQLRDIAKQCNDHQNSIIHSKRQGEARFRDVDQWTLGDLKTLRRQTNDIEDDTLKLEDESLALKTRITELQSLLLKAETSKQEIERLLRAREDKNFAKLLKVRALGPEHLENQTKLRKSIQVANDRVLQLEERVAAMKSRVQSTKNGGNPLKAPSLDIIARTITNIETAALDRRDKMNALTDRLEALDLSVEDSDESGEDERSSFSPSPKMSKSAAKKAREQTPLDEILARPTLTPKIKTVSANALNAERAGLRLKSALLTIRSQPLTNTSVVPKPVDHAKLEQSFSVSFATILLPPRTASPKPERSASLTATSKTRSFTSVVNANSPFGTGKLGQGTVLNFTIPEKVELPAWDPPAEVDEEQSGDSSRRRSSSRGGGRSRHSPSVRLSSQSPSSSPETQKTITSGAFGSPALTAPKFDWGFEDLAKAQSSVANPPGFISLLDYQTTGSNPPDRAKQTISAGLSTSFKTGTQSGTSANASALSNVFTRSSPNILQDKLIPKTPSPPMPSVPSPVTNSSQPSFSMSQASGSAFSSSGILPRSASRGQSPKPEIQGQPSTTANQSPFASNSFFGSGVRGGNLLSRLGPPLDQPEELENQGFLEPLSEEDESGEDEDSRQKHLEEELEDALDNSFDEEQEETSHDDGPWEEDGEDDWDRQGDNSDDDKT